MPYRLIQQLKELERLSIQTLPTNEGSSPLNNSNLSEEAFACLDKIDHTAKILFGRVLKPSIHQQSIMEREGYPVRPGKRAGCIWLTGEIVTPKGIVVYS